MAAELPNVPVNGNGNYAPHQGYGGVEHQLNYNGYASAMPATQQSVPIQAQPSSSAPGSHQPEIAKDEVGWYFVEQYYTTLSRSPEKLYLFYNKRSQFVSGQETDKVEVCVGQRAINDRIKELDFQDCKVRVTNVDSQASDSNIIIQVIGEISNKSQPHKKFTQTFVLATQTNGYFVLNDIFRYLIEEEEEEGEERPHAGVNTAQEVQNADPATESSGYQAPVPKVDAVEPKTLTSSLDPAAIEHDAKQVDKGLEEKVLKEQAKTEQPSPADVNGDLNVEAADETEDVPVATAASEAAPSMNEEGVQSERPKEPEPTPAVASPAPPPSQPAAPAKPATPKTWASLAASANKVPTPATPATAAPNTAAAASATPSAASQAKPAQQAKTTPPATASAQASSTVPTGPAAQRDESPSNAPEQEEWTAVSNSHHRQQSRQTNSQQQEPPAHRGYIKNVHEGIDGTELKATLEKYAEIVYFDIARQKNCAFVDFKTAEGYNAVIKANPHTVSGEPIYVEERKVRPGGPFYPRGGFPVNRGRGGANGGASRGGNYPNSGRGGYPSRGGRGANSAPRGRGSSQAA